MNATLLKENIQASDLIETILRWPKWKKESVCIDRSDIILFEKINDICETLEKDD